MAGPGPLSNLEFVLEEVDMGKTDSGTLGGCIAIAAAIMTAEAYVE